MVVYRMAGVPHSPSSIHILCIFRQNKQMHTLIKLKLCTHIRLIEAHHCTNFGWNSMKIYKVMSIKMLKVYHTRLPGEPLEGIS